MQENRMLEDSKPKCKYKNENVVMRMITHIILVINFGKKRGEELNCRESLANK